MNAFYVPDLAGMIYTMPGMQTELNAVINKPGVYRGMSSHYSGEGFSGMTFKFHGLAEADFDKWVAQAKSEGAPLTREAYLALAKPSARDPVQRFASVEDGQMCMDEMMARDAVRNRSHQRSVAQERMSEQDICTTNTPLFQ